MTVNCTSNTGRIGYSAGPFSRVQFVLDRDDFRTFTLRRPDARKGESGSLVNTVFTECSRGKFRELFLDTADLNNRRS